MVFTCGLNAESHPGEVLLSPEGRLAPWSDLQQTCTEEVWGGNIRPWRCTVISSEAGQWHFSSKTLYICSHWYQNSSASGALYLFLMMSLHTWVSSERSLRLSLVTITPSVFCACCSMNLRGRGERWRRDMNANWRRSRQDWKGCSAPQCPNKSWEMVELVCCRFSILGSKTWSILSRYCTEHGWSMV